MANLEARFLEKVERIPGVDCWIWTGAANRLGYGVMGVGSNATMLAHRASWVIHFGEIPSGLWVLHRCDTPPCVSPGHLYLGDAKQNVSDMIARGRFRAGVVRGSRHGMSKLKEDSVRALRELASNGVSPAALADRFGISTDMVYLIVARRHWKHI